MWRPVISEPKLAEFWEIEEKWSINELFDAHEILDTMAVVREDLEKENAPKKK